MKYLVFSFDDGLMDFYTNAFPIFEKHNMKCSINAITGISDKTVISDLECMTNELLLLLQKKGYEIANHSNSHSKNITFEDLMVANRKLESFLSDKRFGCILPYSQKITNNLFNQISNEFLYLADYKKEPKTRPFLIKFRKKIFSRNNQKFLYYFNNYSYILDLKEFSCDFPTFIRLPIHSNTTINQIKYMIKKMKKNQVVVFMFHSIKKDDTERAVWEEGSWSSENLDKLLTLLDNRNKYSVITQKELINYASK